ncbi:MAG TPA: hypothetical protein VFU25_08195 [Ornithinibacter sp.]|nr:hypothetical protein [Ornithinibacter sp.]
METTQQPTPIRQLIAELADTEDVLRGCRADSPSATHRAARRRQGQIVRELRRRPVAVG